MTQLLLFFAFSLLTIGALTFIGWYKKMSFSALIGLFLFGVAISIPFIMVEFLGTHLKFYFVILSFIAIELGILYMEEHVKYFHDLIHHNIKDLRILSFLLIGLGFTFSEIAFTIFHSHAGIAELSSLLPIKSAYALLMHTVLTSAASLVHIGNLLAETIFETVFKFLSYYIRIAVISISHFLYVFSIEHKLTLLIIPLLTGSIIAFFYFKHHLDKKAVPAN